MAGPSNNHKKKFEEENSNKGVEEWYNYARTNPRDVVAYVLLVLGIILLFFQHIYGGFLIGVVVGIYFTEEIVSLIKNFEQFIEEQGLVRSLIFGGTVLAFFISAPAIFIGAAVVIAIKYLLMSPR